ncbi:MAG: flagellar brake protein [Tissierellia bacterium]|nr:flagellar brake protein [Tissierellia bacterium]
MVSGKETPDIGIRIEITKSTRDIRRYYASQVLDIAGEIFVISGPIYKQNLVMMHEGERIKISYMVEDKGRYTFDAEILERSYEDIYKLKVKKVSDIRRDQRRGFYRFKTAIPVTKESVIRNTVEVEECRTKDISGSGLNLYSNLEHEVGDVVKCRFKVGDHLIDNRCQIMRVDESDNPNYKYSLGISFIKLNEMDKDSIIKFIFLEERLLKEKKLI